MLCCYSTLTLRTSATAFLPGDSTLRVPSPLSALRDRVNRSDSKRISTIWLSSIASRMLGACRKTGRKAAHQPNAAVDRKLWVHPQPNKRLDRSNFSYSFALSLRVSFANLLACSPINRSVHRTATLECEPPSVSPRRLARLRALRCRSLAPDTKQNPSCPLVA